MAKKTAKKPAKSTAKKPAAKKVAKPVKKAVKKPAPKKPVAKKAKPAAKKSAPKKPAKKALPSKGAKSWRSVKPVKKTAKPAAGKSAGSGGKSVTKKQPAKKAAAQAKKPVAKKTEIKKPAKKVAAPVKKTAAKTAVKTPKKEEKKLSFAEQKRINIAAQQKKKHDMKTLTKLWAAQATKNKEAAAEQAKQNAEIKANGGKVVKKNTVNRQQIRDKISEDINELSPELQNLLKKGMTSGQITEDEILTEVDDLDAKIKTVEKFYELAEKLSIKIVTIEEIFEQENKQMQQWAGKLGKIELYEKKYTINDKQYHDHIKLYFNDISKIPLLSAEEEKAIAIRVRRWDENAKKKLIESNLRLVISIAKRFFGSRLSFSDLIQEGNVGLIKAIEKFDPDKDFKFSTYATWWIKQSVTKAIADMTKHVRIPVHLIDEINSYNKAYQELFQKLGREPTSKEIGLKLNFNIKKIKKLEEVIFGNVSLDSEVGDDGKDSLGDLIEDKNTMRPDQAAEKDAIRSNLNYILGMLDEREAKIIKMRYGIDGPKYTLEQVGEEFQVTRERVRQIEQKVLQKLKEHIGLQKILGIEDDIEKMELMNKWNKKTKWRIKISDDDDESSNDYFEDDDDFSYLDD